MYHYQNSRAICEKLLRWEIMKWYSISTIFDVDITCHVILILCDSNFQTASATAAQEVMPWHSWTTVMWSQAFWWTGCTMSGFCRLETKDASFQMKHFGWCTLEDCGPNDATEDMMMGWCWWWGRIWITDSRAGEIYLYHMYLNIA